MALRPRGVLGIFALATLLVASVSPAQTPSQKPASAPSSPSLKVAATAKPTTARKRRVRRGPPGGVVYSRNAVVLDPMTNEVLFEKNASRSVPIASITKLMTALVFVSLNTDLARQVEVRRDDLLGGGKTQLRNHEKVALGDLLHMSLMCSDNVATRVMVRESGIPKQEYLSRMNRKALELGLTETRFVEVTGLDPANVSCATDVARLLRAASDHDMIRSISTTRTYEFRSSRRPHFVANTNRMLYGRYEILGGKTGFISSAGYCLVTWVRAGGRDLIAVALGAPTNATRFADVVRMVQKTTAPPRTNS
jgi:serine-type D-Ala-D-Ala endopeptidase (penicillin-binding protein 7)